MYSRKRLSALASCVLLGAVSLLWGAQAHALPITLTYDPTTSDVRIVNADALCLGCSVEVVKNPNPVDIVIDAVGDTESFPFFSAFAKGVGIGFAEFEARLGFSAPAGGAVSDPATATGLYIGRLFFDGPDEGSIRWTSQPGTLAFSDGTVVDLALSDVTGSECNAGFKGWCFNNGVGVTVDANATLTSVPEPAGIALLGAGLLAFGGAVRRRRSV